MVKIQITHPQCSESSIFTLEWIHKTAWDKINKLRKLKIWATGQLHVSFAVMLIIN